MDVVYVCRDGRNPELLISLRSLKNLPHDKVWIFGGKPTGVHGLEFVRVSQDESNKYKNVGKSLRAICENPDVSDPFILMNDDFFILEKLDEMPRLHRGSFREYVDRYSGLYPSSKYTQGVLETCEFIEKNITPEPLCYELHMPIIVYKDKMFEALDAGSELELPQWRSIYGNIANLGGVRVTDCKLYKKGRSIEGMRFLSTADSSFRMYFGELIKMFPDRSEYE